MRIRQMCACVLMVGGILWMADGAFAGGAAQSDPSKSGTHSGSTMGSGSGSTGGSSGTMKQGQKPGHESSGTMGQDVITKDNPGGIVTRGGRGEVPSDSKVDPLSSDQRETGSGFSPEGTSGNAPGVTGSSGRPGSSGGTGSSGGAGGR